MVYDDNDDDEGGISRIPESVKVFFSSKWISNMFVSLWNLLLEIV